MATLNFPDAPSTGDTYTDSNSGFTYEWNGTVWISKDPSTVSNIREIDNISSSFNGSTTAFTLQVAGVNVEPANVQQLIISVGGVMQNAGDDYTVSGSTLTFTTAPTSGLTFFGTLLGTALSLNTVADGSVSPASLTTTSNYMMGGLTVDQNAGIITAYQFQGDGSGLTGVASTDNIITSYGATFLSNVRVAGIFTAANAYVTGILTAQTLNYNNVTDIYSTGIITATGGIQQTGNEGLHVSSGITTVGILTATSARVGLGVTINNTGIDAGAGVVTAFKAELGIGVTVNNTGIDAGIGAGIITAKEYYGDASNMTGAGSTLSISGFSPLAGSSQLSVNNVSIALNFNQGVKAGSGEITLRKDSVSGTVVENFGVGSSVTYVHGQAVLEPTSTLVNDQKYYLTVPDSGIQNMAESSNIGAINEYFFTTKPFTSKLYSVGDQAGTSLSAKASFPVQIGSKTNWNNLTKGNYATAGALGVLYDGKLYGWGSNSYGELGLNDRTSTTDPEQVGSDKTWDKVAFTYRTGIAIKTDGTLWTWGRNTEGALGHDNTQHRSSPTQVGTNTNWAQIGATFKGVVAVKTDGTMWAWGDNKEGELGQNNNVDYSSPTQIGTLTNWSTPFMSNSYEGSMFCVKTDGTLHAWGYNNWGQLGLNDQTDRSSPIQVGTNTTWSADQIKNGGGKYSVGAIKTDGTLWTWGNNGDGRLGHNGGPHYSSPKKVGTNTNWRSIGWAEEAAMASKTDGTLWAWGHNQHGELGQNNRTDYSSPKQVTAFNFAGPISGRQNGFQITTRETA